MKNRGLLVVFALLCWSGTVSAQTQTFSQVLGPNEVETIVRDVTNAVVTRSSSRVTRIRVEASYLSRVAKMVGQVETDLDRTAARSSLRELYGTFATHVVEFALVNIQGRITLNLKILNRYMLMHRRCGEAPCNMNCDPCNRRCNSCKQ